eukprot:3160564-Karenia_brevis.AAC.1
MGNAGERPQCHPSWANFCQAQLTQQHQLIRPQSDINMAGGVGDGTKGETAGEDDDMVDIGADIDEDKWESF